jgi:hypothetical protein
MAAVAITFFFVFEKKKMTTSCRCFPLRFYCSKEGDDSKEGDGSEEGDDNSEGDDNEEGNGSLLPNCHYLLLCV